VLSSLILKGTGFSPYINLAIGLGLYWLRKNSPGSRFVKGHDFSRAAKANRIKRALAPEGSFSANFDQCLGFSAACLAPEGHFLQIPPLPIA
jgi:hypothetical protein